MTTTITRISTFHQKEYMTCSLCGKYKGCWTDSGICSDCDEAADERKIAENEEAEEGQQQKTETVERKMTPGDRSRERRLLDNRRGARAAVEGPMMFAGAQPAPDWVLKDAKRDLADFYSVVAARKAY